MLTACLSMKEKLIPTCLLSLSVLSCDVCTVFGSFVAQPSLFVEVSECGHELGSETRADN